MGWLRDCGAERGRNDMLRLRRGCGVSCYMIEYSGREGKREAACMLYNRFENVSLWTSTLV